MVENNVVTWLQIAVPGGMIFDDVTRGFGWSVKGPPGFCQHGIYHFICVVNPGNRQVCPYEEHVNRSFDAAIARFYQNQALF